MKPLSLKQKLVLAVVPRLASWIVRSLAWSMRIRHEDPLDNRPAAKGERKVLYAFWHSQILPVVGFFADNDIQSMASRSFDGEIIARALVHAQGSLLHGGRSVAGILDELLAAVERDGLDVLDRRKVGGLAAIRRHELAAALNRLRTLQVRE